MSTRCSFIECYIGFFLHLKDFQINEEESTLNEQSLKLPCSEHLLSDAYIKFYMDFACLPWYRGSRSLTISADDVTDVMRLSHECAYLMYKTSAFSNNGNQN